MSLGPALRKARALSWAERRLALEALAWLAVMRLAIRTVKFRRLVGWMRLAQGETPAQPAPDPAAAERVGWAVRGAAARTPWESACLVQALAAARMLQGRGLPATLYLGAARKPDRRDELHAHAWLRCGDQVLTGENESRRFAVVATFRTSGGGRPMA